MSATIGLDIGGTKVLGVLLADDGTVLREERLASPHAGLDALVATGASIVSRLDAVAAPIGVGAAGLVDGAGADACCAGTGAGVGARSALPSNTPLPTEIVMRHAPARNSLRARRPARAAPSASPIR